MKIKSTLVKATAAAAISITGIAVVNTVKPNLTAHVQAATQQIKINYVAGYGVNIWTNYNHGHFTGKRAAHGSTWNVIDTVTDKKGNTWYEVGQNQWIMGRYAIVLGQSQKPVKKAVSSYSASAVTVPKKVHKKSVQASGNASGVIALAQSEVGKRYVWGATGPSSFDCSGLVQYVFKNAAGINLPRTTYTQIGVGKAISMSNLQPGDLLFWGNYHVGIYIGNGQYIHAATPSQGVKVGTISSYFMPTSARRVLN